MIKDENDSNWIAYPIYQYSIFIVQLYIVLKYSCPLSSISFLENM